MHKLPQSDTKTKVLRILFPVAKAMAIAMQCRNCVEILKKRPKL